MCASDISLRKAVGPAGRSAAQGRDRSRIRPTLLACTACRRKHLRCDTQQPVCSRCASAGLRCFYAPSQRGLRVPTTNNTFMPSHASTSFVSPRSQALIVSSSDGYQDLDILPQRLTWSYNQSSIFTALPTNTGAYFNNNNNQASNSSTEALHSPHEDDQEHVTPLDETPDSVSASVKERLVNLFYSYFYPSHPFLLPKHLFSHRGYPTYLMAAVHFVGSHQIGRAHV